LTNHTTSLGSRHDGAHLYILRRVEGPSRPAAFRSLHRLDNNLTTQWHLRSAYPAIVWVGIDRRWRWPGTLAHDSVSSPLIDQVSLGKFSPGL